MGTPVPVRVQELHAAVLGADIYIAGGLDSVSAESRAAWRYSPATDRWQPRASLPGGRGASAVGVVNGRLVVVGGVGPVRALSDSTAIYDPRTNTWINRAPIPTSRDHLTAVAVGVVVFAIGGRPGDPNGNFDMVEAFDVASPASPFLPL